MEHFCILHSQYFQTERKKQKARTVSVWRHFQSEPVFLRKQWIGWTKSPGCRGTYKITESRLVLTKPVPFRARRNWLAFCCNKNIISDIHYVTDSRHNGPLILFSRRRIVHIVLYNNTEPKQKELCFWQGWSRRWRRIKYWLSIKIYWHRNTDTTLQADCQLKKEIENKLNLLLVTIIARTINTDTLPPPNYQVRERSKKWDRERKEGDREYC